MKIATLFYVSLICAGLAAAQDNPAPVIACNLKAIAAADRPRYDELTKRLRNAVRDRSELAEGYAYKLQGGTIKLNEVAEWISLERLCCPFLTFQLSVAGKETDWRLSLTGPAGVKMLLQAEFPAP
jgi:hypothetical protein